MILSAILVIKNWLRLLFILAFNDLFLTFWANKDVCSKKKNLQLVNKQAKVTIIKEDLSVTIIKWIELLFIHFLKVNISLKSVLRNLALFK